MKYRWVASGAIALAMAFVATSCEDDFGKGGTRDDGTIRFEVVDDDIFVIGDGSRADDATVTVVQSDPIRYFSEIVGQDTIPMSLTESHNSSSRLMGSYATEGKPDSRGTYYTTGAITKFRGVAYTDGGKLFFNEDMTVGTGNIVNTGRFWPATDALTFFGYAKSNGNGKMESLAISNTSSEHNITFNYTMPAAVVADASGNFHDAENQPDLVFAIVPGQKKTAENVPMPFHHALSAITFKVGTMPKDTKVKSIALTGCYTSGKCVATSAPTQEKPSNVAFTWSNCTGAADYEQSFNQDAKLGEPLGNTQHTFLLIPQTYSDDTQKLVITFQIKNYGTDKENEWHTYTMEKPMNAIFKAIDGIDGIKADCHYTFTIGIEKDEVGVTVDDEVVDKVKKNVTITNTGIASGYVRAAIVGYWLRSEDIMIPWSVDDETTGKLTKGGEWETYWVKGTDGYFYYKQELKRGQQTYPLFVTYELTAGAAPVEGALLEINILAQIVHVNYWPSEWPAKTSIITTP